MMSISGCRSTAASPALETPNANGEAGTMRDYLNVRLRYIFMIIPFETALIEYVLDRKTRMPKPRPNLALMRWKKSMTKQGQT